MIYELCRGRCPLRRVKDSNLRAISDSRVSSAVLSASSANSPFRGLGASQRPGHRSMKDK